MFFYSFKVNKKLLVLLLGILIFIVIIPVVLDKYSTVLTMGEPIYRGKADSKKIAFACNVYWGNEVLPRMLEIFDKNNITITFFVGGSWAEKYPDLLKLIYEKGHEIGNHGYKHLNHKNLTLEQNKEEITKAEKAIEKVLKIKTKLFAPPYGEYNKQTLEAAKELGYHTIIWTIDTIDWKEPGKEYIIKKVNKNAKNGAIVLMHPKEDTIKALPELIAKLQEKGFKITSVSDVIF